MKINRKTLSLLVAIMGIAIIGSTAFIFRSSLKLHYWAWRLEVGDQQERIELLQTLGEQGSALMIPDILKLGAQSIKDYDWYVEGPFRAHRPRGSEAMLDYAFAVELTIKDLKGGKDPLTPENMVKAIQNIRKRQPRKAEVALKVYLNHPEREWKWVAALSLFDKYEQLKPYLPKEKMRPYRVRVLFRWKFNDSRTISL